MADPRIALKLVLEAWNVAGVTDVPRSVATGRPEGGTPSESVIRVTPVSAAEPGRPVSAPAGVPLSQATGAFQSLRPRPPAIPESTHVEAVASIPPVAPAPAPATVPKSLPSVPSTLTPETQDMPKASSRPESSSARQKRLEALSARVAQCVRCQELASTRTQTVFGVGNPQAKVMFIGEAPGADEDVQGEPFVGRAGQLLNKIITACGWQREELYICNILRCRPPGNRAPLPQEAANCREYLDGQIEIVRPEYIVCWGTVAAQNLLGLTDAIGKLRGRFFEHGKAKVLCTYHPSYLLRNPEAKKPVWEDMKLLLGEMGLTPPTP